VVGVSLAAIGLATFWGVHIYGKDLMRRQAEHQFLRQEGIGIQADQQVKAAVFKTYASKIKRMEMLGMLLVTTGGGLGLLAFGPLCERIGRRGAFLIFHIGGLVIALVLFQALATAGVIVLAVVLPIFGFLTLGMHAGYAIYFPELYPTRLRGTGGGFCFNVGRILAAPILFISGWMQKDWGFTLESSATLLSMLFLLGCLILLCAPETKGTELPA
jgi:MFS family permease